MVTGTGALTCIFWDVQHGHATYLRTPGGQDIVVDLGIGSYEGNNATFSPLLHLKKRYNVAYLDGLIITHPHRDHIDDMCNYDALAPTALIRPKHLTDADVRSGNQAKDKPILDKYLEVCGRYSSGVAASADPFSADNNGGVRFEVFAPTECARTNLNNHSIVTVVSYADSKILIPGDNEPPSWNELLKRPDFISAIHGTDILLAPHHGRDSGFSEELFKHITPKLTVISDGPYCDTSATGRYAAKTSGWAVHKRDGTQETRKCVTTRNDGVIAVKLGVRADGKPYIQVNID